MSCVTMSELDVREQLKSITECCICSRTYKDPLALPCAHTLCMICLEEAGGRASKIPGDQMPCPMCRKDFTIPKEGYSALQKTFFMEKPIEIQALIASSSEGTDRCEDCMEDQSESESVSEVPFAVMYCTDCQKKLCQECCRYHLKKKMSKNHQVVAIPDFKCKAQIRERSNCVKHEKELDLYCTECKEPLCKLCFGESHQNHRLQDIGNTAEGFKNEIKDILSGLEMCMSIVVKKQGMLSCEVEEYCKYLESLKLDVRAQLRATIMLVSEHANFVIQHIEQLKLQKRKEVEAEVEDSNGDLTCLESFKVFCINVLTKRSASDICCTIDELKERFEDFKKIYESDIETKTDLHRMSFQASDLEEFLKTENYNIIGTIQAGQTEVVGEGETKIVYDKISHDGDKKMEENYGMAISCNNGILVKFNRLKQELDNAQRRIGGLEMEKKDLKKRIDEFRVELGSSRPLKPMSRLQMTQAIQPSCKEVLQPGISVDYKRSPKLVKTMQGGSRSRQQGSISSLTVLDDELFLGCFNSSSGRSVVEVYDIKTFKCKRRWQFKRLFQCNEGVARIRCMASCTTHKCLYVCVSTVRGISGCNPVIQRTDVNGTNGKEWKINSGSRVPNLSVTREGNIIVITSWNSLIEYTRNGELVHEIKTPLGFEHPWHALKLASGNFVVSHGCVEDRLQRVLLLSESGQIVRSFGEKPLSGGQSSEVKEVPQVCDPRVLNRPVHLAVDNFGNILVADRGNNRIVVLNSDLELLSCLTPTAPFLTPNFMYIDIDRRQLFVCEGWRKFSVYNFSV